MRTLITRVRGLSPRNWTAAHWKLIHQTMTWMWIALIIPSMWFWRDSIPWLIFMSIWANVAGHASAWQSARAEQNNGASNNVCSCAANR